MSMSCAVITLNDHNFNLFYFNFLSEIYTSQIQEHSPVVKALFLRLYNITKNESEIHRQMYSIMGCMDAIMSSNSSSVTSAIKPL